MGPINLPPGYVLGEGRSLEDVLRVDAELLASEGLDPEWPGFEEKPEEDDKDS